MKLLLDVNVLIALLWKEHSLHARAVNALTGHEIWICPIVELGFLRISSNPRALGADMEEARRLLEDFIVAWKVSRVADDLPALDSHAELRMM